jgi:hypothetical protein
LEAIVMSANDFDEDEVLTFSQSLAPSLKKIVFSRMDLSSDYAADIFFENIPKNIEHLDISYDQIKANGVTAAANFLLKSNVTTFIAAGNNFTVSEFTELLQAIFDSFVIQLDISDSMLSDEHIHILINFLEKYKNRLVGIKLDMNKIKDESGCRLVAALSAAGVREFSIENNLLTNKFGFELADVIPRSNFTKVNMSSNLMDGDSISAILKAGKLINLAANNMPISDENIVAISKDLIKSPYDLSYVSNDELSIDQKRALHQATPNHEVEVLSLNNCGITDNAKKILLRVLPYTNIESNNVVMHQFQQTESKTPTLFKLRRHGLFSEKNKQYSQEQPINHIAVGIR